MLIKGTVETIIYRNADNGYSVLIVSDAMRSITAVGILPPVTEGESLELEGEFVVNQRYGEQFNVKRAKVCQPTSLDSIAKYLASGLFKGVGEITADNIVDAFGEMTFDIIENQPIRLMSVKGISSSKAMQIHETYVGLKDMQNTILGLQEMDISLNLALKIYKAYGKGALDTVRTNPYRLVEDVDGIGFITADKIANGIGIADDSEFRVRAGVIYILKTVATNSGHTYLPKAELLKHLVKLLGLDYGVISDLMEMAVSTLEIKGIIVVIDRGEEIAIMFSQYYLTERKIANKLITLNNTRNEILTDIEADINEFESITHISMHENQKEAVRNAVKYGVNIITGGPGTGKTTIVKCILSIFAKLGLKTQLCAPTGRASKRLAESTGREAKTIHRLLDLNFKQGKGKFTFREDNNLDADVVIVDEVSMCDEYVFSALLSAIKHGGRMILVGDKDQLPSVGAGNVLGDLIEYGDITVSQLTYIYRQQQESLIVENAHRINDGEMPIIRNRDSDFVYDEVIGHEEIATAVEEMVATKIPKYLGVSPMDIQVLCPMKKSISGVNNMNTLLQARLNPPMHGKPELKYGDMVFRKGDKVIHLVNNYDLEWLRGDEVGIGVFNGDIGFITDVNVSDGTLTVGFEDDRIATYTRDIFDQIKLAYAISVHKSQGSEFDVVITVLMGGSYTLMTRNLLYTAVTRAKNMSVIVGDRKHLYSMVKNDYTAKRYTLLVDLLREESERQKYVVGE